ncbi:MAG: LUD domain-containing protein [Bacteroidales bacterium]|nr:LUD domain-containing protein [Bacteroidales bacterium]
MKDRMRSDKGTTTKEQILAKVRNATIEKPEAMFKDIDLRTDTWMPIKEEDGNAITFVQKFKDMGGIFIYLEDEAEFGECMKQLAPQNGWEPLWCSHPAMQELLNRYGIAYSNECQREEHQKLVAFTSCQHLIAQTGSILLTDLDTRSRRTYTEADVLLILAHTDQIVSGLKEALHNLNGTLDESEISQAIILTGMTRTYDIEQNLVFGVHGPRQIAVFLIDD